MWRDFPGDPREIPALALAYIGDAMYELYIRMYLLQKGAKKVNELHKAASSLVKASSQARFLHLLEPLLTDEEKDMARRGRNTKSTHVPKNAEMSDYRASTGFEALFGYLFILKREERIKELLDYIIRNG